MIMHVLFARTVGPDLIDAAIIVAFLALAFLPPASGYVLMVVDIRAYLRALRGALIKVAHFFPELPAWVRYETPGCLSALGLCVPCTEQEVKRAYRRLAEDLHPDRGGDTQRFLQLQVHFETALEFVRRHEPVFRTDRR